MPNLLKLKRGAAATIPNGSIAEPLFTTDTYDLYIGKGNGTNQRFQKYIASGTSSQFLKGDGSLDSTSYQPSITLTTTGSSGASTFISNTLNVPTYSLSGLGGEPAITPGTTSQYWRGDKSWQTLNTSVVPESGAIYFTEPRVLATVLTGLNLSGGGTIAATDSILTAFGKVQNQISALVGGATYQGVWNASTNSPSLASGVGTKGYYYVVSVAGSTNLDGITDWKVGDWAIFNGTAWDKVDNTDAVSSVNGFTGAVNLGLGDISNVALSSPTNAQLLRFNGTSSKWENWTPTYISAAITSLNGLTAATQTFAVGTSGTDFAISSSTSTHTFNLPTASATNRGALSSADWSTFNSKQAALTFGNLTEATSSVLTITGGTGAVIGSGTTIQVKSASATQNGVVTTGTQTFAGNKTFSDKLIVNNSLNEVASFESGNANTWVDLISTTATWSIGSTASNSFQIYTRSTTPQAVKLNVGVSASTFYTTLEATSFIRTSGTSSQFLKGDGSVDTNTYLTTSSAASTYLPLAGGTTTGAIRITSNAATDTSGLAIGVANNSAVRWRNAANTANLGIYLSVDNEWTFDTAPMIVNGILSAKGSTNSVDSIRFYNTDGNYGYIKTTAASNSNNIWFDGHLGSTTWINWYNPGQLTTANTYSKVMIGTGRGTENEKIEFNRGRIYQYNSSGTNTITLNGLNGTASFGGDVTLAGGSDLIITPATSGVNAVLYNDIGVLVSTASISVQGTGQFSGAVGINGATAVAELQVGKSSDVTIAMSNSSSVTSGNRGNIAWYNSSNSTVATIRATADTDNVGTNLLFYTRPVGGTLTKAMTIDSNGRIGMGMDPTNVALAVYGAITTSNGGSITAGGMISSGSTISSGSNITAVSDISGASFIPNGTSAPVTGMYQPSAGAVGFATSTTKRIEISTGGATTITGSLDVLTSSGIGTSGVSGIARIVSGGTAVALSIGQSNSTRYTGIGANYIYIYNDDFFLTTIGSFPLSLGTSNTARLTIGSTGASSFTSTLSVNSPSGGATGEGLVVGKSLKIDATGTSERAVQYMVSNTLSNTYGSGLQLQGANTAGDKAFGFNLNTSGGFETYTKNSGGSFVKGAEITKDGYVSFPQQPAMLAQPDSGSTFTTTGGSPNAFGWNTSGGIRFNNGFTLGAATSATYNVANAGSTGKITVPAAGKYLVQISIRNETEKGSTGQMYCWVNGTQRVRRHIELWDFYDYIHADATFIVDLSANDYLEFGAWWNASGVNGAISGTNDTVNWLSIVKVK